MNQNDNSKINITMKKYSLVYLFVMALCFVACNNDSEDWSNEKHYMRMDVLGEEHESETPFPCVILNCDEWVLIEYTTNGMKHQDVVPFVCINKVHNISYLLLGYENSVVLAQYDLLTASMGEYAIFMSTHDNIDKYSLVKIEYKDKNTDIPNFTLVSEVTQEAETNTKKAPQKRTQDDYTDEFTTSVVQLMAKYLDDFESKASVLIDAAEAVSFVFKGSISTMSSVLSFATTAVRRQMIDVPGLDEEVKKDLTSQNNKSVVMTICNIPWTKMFNALNMALNCTPAGRLVVDEFNKTKEWLSGNDDEEDDAEQIPVFGSQYVDNVYEYTQFSGKEAPKYIVKLQFNNSGETTANLTASYSYGFGEQMSYVSSKGIVFWNKSTNEKFTQDWPESGRIQLENLNTLTEYGCYAFMKSFGEEYRSGNVFFTTKGDLTLSPSKLSFTAEGGEKEVVFSVSKSNITVWDYTAPEWCEVKKLSEGFKVVVGANEKSKALSGTINISMQLNCGQKTTASLAVTQEKAEKAEEGTVSGEGWDGTSWSFSNGSKFDFTIKFIDVKNDKATYGGFLDEKNWDEVYVREYKDAEVEGVIVGADKWGSTIEIVDIFITRTGKKTAIAELEYSANSWSGSSSSESIVLKGTLK